MPKKTGNIPITSSTACKIFLCHYNHITDRSLLKEYQQLLNDEEIVRYQQMRSDSASQQFLVSRVLLRTVLAQEMNCRPEKIVFDVTSTGKPFIKQPVMNPIRFNLSHSFGKIVLAVSPQHPIGIDIEYLHRKNDLYKLAERYFHAREYEQLNLAKKSQKRQLFFSIWTLKEAFIKATGYGLAQSLNSFFFEFFPSGKLNLQSSMEELTDITAHYWSYRGISDYPMACLMFTPHSQQQPPECYEFFPLKNNDLQQLSLHPSHCGHSSLRPTFENQ